VAKVTDAENRALMTADKKRILVNFLGVNFFKNVVKGFFLQIGCQF